MSEIGKIRKANAAALLDRLQQKKHPLTQAQLREVDEVLAEQEQSAADTETIDKPRGDTVVVHSRLLAAILGVTHATVYNWRKLGMPQVGPARFDVVVCCRWWRENILSTGRDDETLTEAKRKYWQAKVVNLDIRNAALRGEYVRHADVNTSSASIAAMFRNAVRSWRTRLPPMLVGKPADEMLPLIEREMDAALTELSVALAAGPAAKPKRARKAKPKPEPKRKRGRPRKAKP